MEERSRLIAPDRHSTGADVENSYRLFLAREPDTGTAVTDRIGFPLPAVFASFLLSDEFKTKMRLADGQVAVSETMLLQLGPDLVDWVSAMTKPGFVEDSAPCDRLTVIRRLLDDDTVKVAVGAAGSHHIDDIDALKTALDQLDDLVDIVDASPLFDPSHYAGQLPADLHVANPAAHYVLLGERLGLKPSSTFDPAMYVRFNADVAASDLNRLAHYDRWGRQEGRVHRDWLIDHAIPPIAPGSALPTVLLLLHEATYTGAPILGWNLVKALSECCNVVVVLRRGGELEGALRDVAAAVIAAPPLEATLDAVQMDLFAERLAAIYQPLYVIANSVESRPIAVALRGRGMPIVALIHEFWPGARAGVQLDFYAACAALVFPARLVEQSSFYAFREIRLQNRFILPQGPCAIPPFDRKLKPPPYGPGFVTDNDAPASLDMVLADGRRGQGPFTVIGLGAVEMRKGIDLFISTATALDARYPDIAFRFIWIGTWEHAIGSQYAALLDEQYRRSGLGDRLYFFPAVDDLEPVYARADALLLSSRLDPLPNITIDAAFRGIPVVCFDRASGTAEMLSGDPGTAALVVPHLDSGAAAERIAALARDPGLWTFSSAAIQRLARRSFDMTAYAQTLDRIGHDAARKVENTQKDQQLIDEADALDASIYFAPDDAVMLTEATPSAVYADRTRHINFASPAVFGVILRRPRAGFHPFIYGTEAPDFPRDGSRDPLAHYVERGMPEGRWVHQVLRPDLVAPTGAPQADTCHREIGAARNGGADGAPSPVALHGHFHYPDNIGDFMTALAANQLRADLYLTTTSVETAGMLRAATKDYRGGKVVVETGPNVGRDIYAFLRVLGTHIHERYELVGHIHGKRSVHTQDFDPGYGDRWRRSLWEQLIGPSHRAADMIVDALRRDHQLGLVFPENAFLVGWEKNADSAAALARRVGLRRRLPPHIEFPAGTMFWARVAALDALVRANFDTAEMPIEPIPIDGTVLHALERMLPLLCEEAGYTYATTHIPHLGR